MGKTYSIWAKGPKADRRESPVVEIVQDGPYWKVHVYKRRGWARSFYSAPKELEALALLLRFRDKGHHISVREFPDWVHSEPVPDYVAQEWDDRSIPAIAYEKFTSADWAVERAKRDFLTAHATSDMTHPHGTACFICCPTVENGGYAF